MVYVVDDNENIRQSLGFLLATKRMTVHSFASGFAFLDAVDCLPAAPIILDLRMPGMTGIEFMGELEKNGITWPVIMLTGHGEIAAAVDAIKLGAIDFLEKPVQAEVLEKCLDRAFIDLQAGRTREQSKATSSRSLAQLTPRESEVLFALCQGKSNKQVAFALSISPRTVEMHRAKGLRRLGVRTLAEVVSLLNPRTAG
jgi:two-component system response regulator FixJ